MGAARGEVRELARPGTTSGVELRRLYLLLAILGGVVPTAFVVYFVADRGFHPILFVEQFFASPIATATFLDVTIASVVFWIWLAREAPAAGVPRWWLFVVANLLVGLCFALPLFLFVREGRRRARVYEAHA